MQKFYWVTLFLFFFLQTTVASYAQKYVYENYGVNDGLPSSEVYDFYQDQEGHMWFATDRGLARYNGYEFESFGINDGLPGNVILGFFPQKNGQIWGHTLNNKLFYFHEKFDGFISYDYNSLIRDLVPKTQILESVFFDENDNIHLSFTGTTIHNLIISAQGEVLKVYYGNGTSDKDIPISINCHVSADDVPFIYFDCSMPRFQEMEPTYSLEIFNTSILSGATFSSKSVCAFIQDGSVVLVDDNGSKIKDIKVDKRPLDIVALDKNRLLIGYAKGGASIIDSDGNQLGSFLDGKSVTNAIIDREGGYWFSTLSEGVFYFKNFDAVISDFPRNKRVAISSLSKNRKKGLYVGYENGDVLYRDSLGVVNEVYTSEELNSIDAQVEFYQKQDALFYYSNHLFIEKKGKREKSSRIAVVRKFSEETIGKTIVTFATGFGYFDVNDSLLYVPAHFKITDALYVKNRFYLSSKEGLYSYSDGSYKNEGNSSKLLSDRIQDIDYNSDSNQMYLGTMNYGLVVHSLDQDRIFSISKADGLYSNIINEVYIENETDIWLATNGGINKIEFNDQGGYRISGINSVEGLVSNEVNDIEIIDNVLWAGTNKGLMQIPKAFFSKKSSLENVSFRLKQLQVNDERISESDQLEWSYNENSILFTVEGISLKHQDQLNYYYKLEGLSDVWYRTTNRNIKFPSLSHGKYTFKSKVCSNEKLCSNNVLEYSFIIRPPFWKTYWFYIVILVFISAVVYWFFKVKILLYNRDVTRELIRLLYKKVTKKQQYLTFKEAGQEVRISSLDILYVKSSGNYIDVVTEKEQFTFRYKISEFTSLISDPLEYLRVHRTYIVRLDNVRSKSSNKVVMNTGKEIPVSKTYQSELDKIVF